MKKEIIFSFFLIVSIISYSQNKIIGTYEYKVRHFYERITLFSDGTFQYFQQQEFLKIDILGNWQIRNDSNLVLDSRPQRTKLIVTENYNEIPNYIFKVRNMKGELIRYYFYQITNDNDTIVFKDQLDQTVSRANVKSFFIVDSKGLKSPTYQIIGKNANYFNVKFEHRRVFENEHWKYKTNYIIPLGMNNEYAKYKLQKKNDE